MNLFHLALLVSLSALIIYKYSIGSWPEIMEHYNAKYINYVST